MSDIQQAAQEINLSSGNLGDGLLSSIFGPNWMNLYEQGPTSAIGPLLKDIFTIYNGAVALGTSFIVGYFIISAAMQTAHEGKVFGKRYSSLWAPLRMAFGGALIVPVFGMSLVQYLVLTFAGFGFYTADSIADKVAIHLTSGRPLTTFPAFFDSKKDKALLAILQLETCKAYQEEIASTDIPVVWDGNKVQYGKKPLLGWSDSSCGILTVDAHYYQVARYAIEEAALILRKPAQDIVAGRVPLQFDIQSARARLAKMDIEIADVARVDVDKEAQDSVTKFAASVAEKGWITLGGWYYTLAQQTSRFNERVAYDFTLDAPNYDNIIDSENGGIKSYIIDATRYAQKNNVAVTSANDQDLMQYIAKQVFDVLKSGGDPYLKLINLGHYCNQAAIVATGAKVVVGAASLLGAGKVVTAISSLSGAGDFGTTVIYILIAAGIMLSCVLPFIPYCVWFFGVCSVLIGILQSVLAAPIWAAAHCLPEGDGIAGTHAKQGYMLLMSMILRPIMITIGFVFSFYILSGTCWIFLSGLEEYVVNSSVNTPGFDIINFFLKLAVTLIIAGFVVAVIAVRSFGFVFEAADKVLAWIGGQEQLGTADKDSAAKIVGAAALIMRGGRVPGAGKMKKAASGAK